LYGEIMARQHWLALMMMSCTSFTDGYLRFPKIETSHRKIQKKVGAMPEKYGRGDQPFTTYKTRQKKGRTTAEQETYNEVRKKQRQWTS
jgi:hypothetical protein